MKLTFNFKYKDYELRACPIHLGRPNKDDLNETIDFVKWRNSEHGPCCYSIAYWKIGLDGYELKFVGNRFLNVNPTDVPVLWKAIVEAQKTLDKWFEETKEGIK